MPEKKKMIILIRSAENSYQFSNATFCSVLHLLLLAVLATKYNTLHQLVANVHVRGRRHDTGKTRHGRNRELNRYEQGRSKRRKIGPQT